MTGKPSLKGETPGSDSSRKESTAYSLFPRGGQRGAGACPRFLIHIFPLMSGVEHPFLRWQLGCSTKKSRINGTLCEQSPEQLDIVGHTAVVGQMGTSGSLPQRLSCGGKANEDDPICHCRPEAPGSPTLGRGDWVSLPWEWRRESGRRTSCVPGPFSSAVLGPVTMRDNIPGTLGDCLEEFGRVCTFAIWGHTKGPR